MPFITRNEEGIIVDIYYTRRSPNDEVMGLDSAELIEYMKKNNHFDEAKQVLSESDHGLIRVIEDLVSLLVEKNLILSTDLPYEAREKLSSREKVRGQLSKLANLMDDDEGIL